MAALNTYIRSLMQSRNVLKPDVSVKNSAYGLGTNYTPNLDYGHTGARIGNLP